MSFTKIHLKLNRNDFIPAGVGQIVEQVCDYDHFKTLMTRVGQPSNWNLRKEYQTAQREVALKNTFNSYACRLWIYQHKETDIGFCQVAQVEDLSKLFCETRGVVEMYKMGLFPEYTGKGLARNCVSSVLKELF